MGLGRRGFFIRYCRSFPTVGSNGASTQRYNMIGANCGVKEGEDDFEKMAKIPKNISGCISKERGLEDFGRKYIYEVPQFAISGICCRIGCTIVWKSVAAGRSLLCDMQVF